MGMIGRLRAFAKQWTKKKAEQRNPSTLGEELLRLLIEYGRTSDERMIDEISPVYLRAADEMPVGDRLELLQ